MQLAERGVATRDYINAKATPLQLSLQIDAVLMLYLPALLFFCCLLTVETAMSSASASQLTEPYTKVCGLHETAHQRHERGLLHQKAPTSDGDHSTRDEIQCQQLVPYEPVRFLPFQDPKRESVFASRKWVIVQQWNEIGLAAVVWEAAIALCQYLETLGSSTLSGRRVIELGAGTGLAGMVASALGAQSVILTDRNTAPAEANLQLNRHNLEGRTITISHLEWGVEEDIATFSPPFDVILAADVVYVEESFPLLIKSLDDLADSHTLVLLSCKHRYESYMKFFQLLREKFDSEIVWYNQDIKVYRCRKR